MQGGGTFMNRMDRLDRYETRRLALKALVDELGRGGRATVAKRIEKEPSYIARMLYPPGKDGRKRIGDELVDAITRAYPDWLTKHERQAAAPAPRATARTKASARTVGDYIEFDAYSPPQQSAETLPSVAEHLELAAWEIRRKIGYTPEPGRIQLFTHRGPSMRPILEDGDLAFVDTFVTRFDSDDYYLVNMGGDIQVKMLQRRGPDLWVVNQNPDHPSWRCEDESSIAICGKVALRAGLRTM